jgi:hypothetical protein
VPVSHPFAVQPATARRKLELQAHGSRVRSSFPTRAVTSLSLASVFYLARLGSVHMPLISSTVRSTSI